MQSEIQTTLGACEQQKFFSKHCDWAENTLLVVRETSSCREVIQIKVLALYMNYYLCYMKYFA